MTQSLLELGGGGSDAEVAAGVYVGARDVAGGAELHAVAVDAAAVDDAAVGVVGGAAEEDAGFAGVWGEEREVAVGVVLNDEGALALPPTVPAGAFMTWRVLSGVAVPMPTGLLKTVFAAKVLAPVMV